MFNTAHVQTNFYTFAPSSSTPDTTHVLSYGYDAFGNTTLTENSGDSGGLPAYTIETYANEPEQSKP